MRNKSLLEEAETLLQRINEGRQKPTWNGGCVLSDALRHEVKRVLSLMAKEKGA